MSKYFQSKEFDSPDAPGSGDLMDQDFLFMLENAREFAGISFVVNSGFRTPSHNTFVGGKTMSAHLRGKAADIAAVGGIKKYIIVDAAIKANIPRIGIGKDFIHLDNDISLPTPSIWSY